MNDDVVVIFIGVGIFLSQDKDGAAVFIWKIKRRTNMAQRPVASYRNIILAPMKLKRWKLNIRINRGESLDCAVN